jgi:hypothetical protein
VTDNADLPEALDIEEASQFLKIPVDKLRVFCRSSAMTGEQAKATNLQSWLHDVTGGSGC